MQLCNYLVEYNGQEFLAYFITSNVAIDAGNDISALERKQLEKKSQFFSLARTEELENYYNPYFNCSYEDYSFL